MQTTFKNTIKKYDEDPAERARAYAAENMGQAGSFNLPSPPVPSKNIKMYDINTDYTAKMNDAIARGDYGAATQYERLHNVKNGDLGLGYPSSGIFNYIDTKGLGGLKEGKRQEIQDFINQGFSYNHEDDPEYKAIRRLKEKEADKAYKDGYAQLSRAFDGDIPVNMINKLLTTKSEITDQADSYIPTLRQMAYNMYMDKGNNLYREYGILSDEEAADYNRWLNNRDMFISGTENAYNRRWNEDERDWNRLYKAEDRDWNRNYMIDEREYNRGRDKEDRDYKRGIDERNWKWKTREE